MKAMFKSLFVVLLGLAAFTGCRDNNKSVNDTLTATTPTDRVMHDDDSGMNMIHRGMDMVKSGNDLMHQGQMADDKAVMERGM